MNGVNLISWILVHCLSPQILGLAIIWIPPTPLLLIDSGSGPKWLKKRGQIYLDNKT